MYNVSDIDKYISEHTSAEDPVLSQLDRATNLRVVQARMISGHVQGKFLELISKILAPERILEIGTFTGYSAICLAKGLGEDGQLHTIEINDELEDISSEFFERSGMSDKIIQHIGSALDIMPTLGIVFDLVFIDGNKREYVEYYDMLFEHELVRSGSVIIADNVIWYEKVVQEVAKKDTQTQKIIEFNDKIQNDDRVENVMLDIRDGMSMIRIK
ncbi:MAG: class I SAM-dependent methyltransferase [Rikenellaceae bacterium]|nr:class I SAM-dependent methyltransferase [Rikenellaceae bacterium]